MSSLFPLGTPLSLLNWKRMHHTLIILGGLNMIFVIDSCVHYFDGEAMQIFLDTCAFVTYNTPIAKSPPIVEHKSPDKLFQLVVSVHHCFLMSRSLQY
jgi:hypothetical protein